MILNGYGYEIEFSKMYFNIHGKFDIILNWKLWNMSSTKLKSYTIIIWWYWKQIDILCLMLLLFNNSLFSIQLILLFGNTLMKFQKKITQI